MRHIKYFFLFIGFCANSQFRSVSVDTILSDKISIRAIAIDGNKIWYAGDNGKFGTIDTEAKTRSKRKIFSDSLKPEFRSIAMTAANVFLLNIGNPAELFRIPKDDSDPKPVYTEQHPKIFYDSMQFWNGLEGMAVGDPVDDCFSIIITRDGGNTWKKSPCPTLPKLKDGEAAFAASNSNIVIKGNDAWIASRGKKSRIFYSSDKGISWKAFDTPMIDGGTTTGTYSADFYDGKNGIIVGGNYEKPTENSKNKAITSDGGKTWKIVSDNAGFGYASCVQYIPESNAKGIVCVGASGLFYSSDGGNSWQKLLDDADLYTIRFKDSETAAAAGKNKIVLLHFKK